MTSEGELLAAISASGDDMGPRLVYADWLLANNDERGELITFDEADRRGHFQRFVDDPALHRLLELSAHHGFPRFSTDPDIDTPFVFEGGRFEYGDHIYSFEREPWALGVRCITDEDGFAYPTRVENRDPERDWTQRELEAIPMIASRALRLGRRLDSIDVPYSEALIEHARIAPTRVAQTNPLFGVVDYERWGQLWKRWFRRP